MATLTGQHHSIGLYSSPTLHCSDMEYGISILDGTYGRKLFYEARGYTVTTCYNQATDNNYAGGFSFAQYKAEIDAGRPVMLNMASATAGHTVVGVGYDDSTNTVYLHDTWHNDGTTQSMTWTGTFSGYAMTLRSVSIVNLAPTTADVTTIISGLPSSVIIGDNITYDIIVINNGPATATNVTLTDILPAGLPMFQQRPAGGHATAPALSAAILV